jgi:hypothetical protein
MHTLDYDEEVTVLAPAAPIGAPLTISSSDVDLGPSIVDDDEEERLDDELSDEDEVISAGGVMEEEDDEDADTDNGEEDAHDGAPTATFMKSPDATGLSGLLNPRRPPTGGRDGFGSRLPTPYAGSGTGVPAPSTSPFASRLGPPPTGGSPPYGTRATHTQSPIPTIQVPPPSGAATTATGPTFFSKQVPMPGVALLCFGFLALGFGLRGAFTGKSAPPVPTTIVAKPTAAAPAPGTPVVEPVARPASTAAEAVRPAPTAEPIKPAPAEVAPLVQAGTEQDKTGGVEQALWKPTTKKAAAPKPKKTAVEAEEEAALKPAATAPKAPATATPKAAPPAAPKSAKKPAKAWVDPFAG